MIGVTRRDSDQFNVRFPDGLRDLIRRVASKNHRSMNSEIIARLESTLEQEQEGMCNEHSIR
jgi:predicted HicB family RNase H-like nuclease